MSKKELLIEANISYAKQWLSRARKDFNVFKKLVSFDKKTRNTVKCSDPALAVYLLQQSIEKAVKALAIASGQYKTRDFSNYYKHNSLGLILNLIKRICDKVQFFGLSEVTNLIGVNLPDAGTKLSNLEAQVMEKSKLNEVSDNKVDFKKESICISPGSIDILLDMLITMRSLFKNVIKSAYQQFNQMGLNKMNLSVGDTEPIIKVLLEGIADDLKINSLTNSQIKAQVEFTKYLNALPLHTTPRLKRTDITSN